MSQDQVSPMNDADLVRQAIEGRPSASEQLVRRWSARLIGYLRSKVAARDVAEDLAQDVLLRALQSLKNLHDPAKFGSWLLSIAHHAAQDWHKARARSEVRLTDRGDDHSSAGYAQTREPTPLQSCQMKEERELILREVDNLPDKLREVLMIYYYDSVTYAELAEMLDVSVATINARLTQARATLRARLVNTGSMP